MGLERPQSFRARSLGCLLFFSGHGGLFAPLFFYCKKPPSFPLKKQRLPSPYLVFLLVCLLFLANSFLFPRFNALDEVFYKAAGKSIVYSGGFAAPDVTGAFKGKPGFETVFMGYPPLYPLFFGLWCLTFGFGWFQCIAYDAVIHVGLMAVCFRLGRVVRENTETTWRLTISPYWDIAAPLLLLVFLQTGRPDELAMLFAMLALLVLWKFAASLRTAVLSAAFFGLSLSTSWLVPFAFALPAAVAFSSKAKSPAQLLGCIIAGVLTVTAILAATYGQLLLQFPDGYQQFTTSAQTVVKDGVLEGLRSLWEVKRALFFLTLAVLVLATASLRGSIREQQLAWFLKLWGAALLSAVIVFSIRPKYTYLWILLPYLLTLGGISMGLLFSHGSRRFFSATALLCSVLILASLPWPLKEFLVSSTLPDEQSPEYNQKLLLNTIPKGATIVTNSAWWYFGKDYEVYDSFMSNIENLEQVDFYILSGNGAGNPGDWFPPSRRRYREDLEKSYTPIQNNLPQSSLKLFGQNITNSAWGHGNIVFGRRTHAAKK